MFRPRLARLVLRFRRPTLPPVVLTALSLLAATMLQLRVLVLPPMRRPPTSILLVLPLAFLVAMLTPLATQPSMVRIRLPPLRRPRLIPTRPKLPRRLMRPPLALSASLATLTMPSRPKAIILSLTAVAPILLSNFNGWGVV
nr:MAG TPA: hypothetical protein [Caudoviricetes sp.]